jgi:hypothetical protein
MSVAYIRAMASPNPGGRLDLSEVRGRDADIARLWKVLGRQSLVLSAERRIGKTHTVLKLAAEASESTLCVYQDLEGVHSIAQLAREIYASVSRHLSARGKVKAAAVKFWTDLMPKRVGDLDLPTAEQVWKETIRNALLDVLSVNPDGRVLLIWDEFPLMLYNLQKVGPALPIQLLDVLRQIRQEHDRLRFLFTGSVGLHLVLRSLRRAGNANDPTNDMQTESLPPLSKDDATSLASDLITSLPNHGDNVPAIAAAVYEAVGGFPYYIHHVVDQLSLRREPLTSELVIEVRNALIYAETDPAHLKYYADRIELYYDEPERTVAHRILDAVSSAASELSTTDIADLIAALGSPVSPRELEAVLSMLCQDHYLVVSYAGGRPRYQFRWTIVRDWWKRTF